MKAPKSRRSALAGRACWAFFILYLVSVPVYWILNATLDVGLISNHHHRTLFFSVVLPLVALWVASGVAYTISRLNDAWAEEYRERRAAARAGLPLLR